MTSTLPNDNLKKNFDDQFSNKLISEIIRDRIKLNKKRFHANDNISDFINPGELEILQKEVASKVRDLLKSLIIDIDNDHNSASNSNGGGNNRNNNMSNNNNTGIHGKM